MAATENPAARLLRLTDPASFRLADPVFVRTTGTSTPDGKPTTGWASTDGRFVLARNWREPQRGGNGPVQDGWTVTDLATGAKRRDDTLADAREWACRWTKTEQSVPAGLLSFDQPRAVWSNPLCELWGTGPDGNRVRLGLFGNDDRLDERIAALLARVGQPGLRPKN